ncbi:MAG TPA: VWA domain-containing protein, partial [Blastocatellia bacterium]
AETQRQREGGMEGRRDGEKKRRSLSLSLCLSVSLSLCLALMGLAPQLAAQDPQDKGKQDKQIDIGTIRFNTDLVNVDVIVTDSNGNRITSALKPSDFMIYEDGVRQTINSFSSTDAPFNLVLLLDTSGSARDEIDLMRRAALRFLDELRPADRVAVIQFNKQVEMLSDLSSDRAEIEDALQLLKPGSGTSFYDSLKLAIDEVFKGVEGRKAVVALTDGVDSFGYTTYDQILTEIESSNVLTYFLELDTEAFSKDGMTRACSDENHFEFSPKQFRKYIAQFGKGAVMSENQRHCTLPPMDRMEINQKLYESARRELREMADKTAGRVYTVKNLQQLEPAYSQIASELRTYYSMSYYPTNENHNGKWRTLRVKVNRRGFTAKTRPGYRARIE